MGDYSYMKPPSAPEGAANSVIGRLRGGQGSESHGPATVDLRSETGAAMVEMAMVFSLLIVLLVGTITSAIAFGQNNSIENSAREASRFAATLPVTSEATWLQAVRDVARAAAHGDLDAGVPGQYICVALVDGSNNIRLTDTGGSEDQSNADCYDDGRPDGELRVQVVTEREATIEAVFFSTDVTLSAQAAARFERD